MFEMELVQESCEEERLLGHVEKSDFVGLLVHYPFPTVKGD